MTPSISSGDCLKKQQTSTVPRWILFSKEVKTCTCLVCFLDTLLGWSLYTSLVSYFMAHADWRILQLLYVIQNISKLRLSRDHYVDFLLHGSCWLVESPTFVCHERLGFSRGHRPVVDTCANEAIPQWGKHDLISHAYLHRHCHGDETMFGYPFGFRVDWLLASPYRNLGSCHGTTGA